MPDVAFKSWQLVPDFPQPFLFPITHPNYPLASGPVDIAAAEVTALQRVVYGPTAPPAGANFGSLHDQLVALVAGGPPGPASLAMAAPERAAQSVAGVPSPAAPGLDAPSVPSLHPLDLVLLGSLHPAVAQMVGLSLGRQDGKRGDGVRLPGRRRPSQRRHREGLDADRLHRAQRIRGR